MKSKALGHRAMKFRGCCGSVPPHRSADTTGGTIKKSYSLFYSGAITDLMGEGKFGRKQGNI